MSNAYTHEPEPKRGKQVVWNVIMSDIEQRANFGLEKYGHCLETFNGRDPLWDAYQEALDLVMYLRQAIMERDTTNEA
jgi:hypothetical protein